VLLDRLLRVPWSRIDRELVPSARYAGEESDVRMAFALSR
jgi:hypothetical protein